MVRWTCVMDIVTKNRMYTCLIKQPSTYSSANCSIGMLVTTTSSPSWGPIRHYKGRNKVIDCSLNMPQFDRYWSQSASSPLSLGQTAKSLVGDLEVRSKCLAKRGHNVALLRIYLGFQTLRNQFLGFWNWTVGVINKLLSDLRGWRWCGRGWGDCGTIMVRLVLS